METKLQSWHLLLIFYGSIALFGIVYRIITAYT